jgi:hypothetical protein
MAITRMAARRAPWLPITGGSGQFQGAGGQVVSRDVSTPTQPQVELTFHLEF